MSLIGYTVVGGDPLYENQFHGRFSIKRENLLRGSLFIGTVNLTESAVYYCAASTR